MTSSQLSITLAVFMLVISMFTKFETEYIQRAIFWVLLAIYFKLGEKKW